MSLTESSSTDATNAPDLSAPCTVGARHRWHRFVRVKFYQLIRCSTCGLIATEEKLGGTYDGVYRCGAQHKDSYLRNTLPGRLDTWAQMWPLLEPFRQNHTLLEVGAGYGYFIAQAEENGWRCVGLEPSSYSAKVARDALGIDVRELRLTELPEDVRDFDVVGLWDVIEHLEDPSQMLVACRERLRPGGVVVIRTPDARIFDAPSPRIVDRVCLAAHIQLVYPANPAEHIYHFTPEVLCRLLNLTGYDVIRTVYETLPLRANLKGRTPSVSMAKRLTARITKRKGWPHEFTVLAQKPLGTTRTAKEL